MVRKNPTSARKKGDDYQDIWGLLFIADWLLEPTRYKWIKYESLPLDDMGSRFSLDDIVLCCEDDTFYLYQSKHKQEPDEKFWTWEDLLKQEPGKNKPLPSLIQKWFSSYHKPELKEKIRAAAFLTNGSAEPNLLLCIEGGKISLEKLKQISPDVYSTLESQLIDKALIDEFFAKFEFKFEQLDVDKLRAHAEKRYLEELRATKQGFLNLYVRTQTESQATYTRTITLADVRAWCEFDTPRELNQSFEIPTDFQYFNEQLHKSFMRRLEQDQGGVQVLVGRPGAGKSTYLSQLHSELVTKKMLCIRHHYYLSANDKSASERLVAERVFEALKAECKKHPSLIGILVNLNSANVRLREFISQIASKCREKKQCLFLIIDGLDHVLRYATPSELRAFLDEICIPQDGLWIILGMQEIANAELPLKIKEICPKDAWIEVPGLASKAVKRLIKANHTKLKLPTQKNIVDEICAGLFSVTEGNPLHLRYCLNSLKYQNDDRTVSRYEIEKLLPFSGDIARYYEALWQTLPEFSKTIALAITEIDYPLTPRQLNEVISALTNRPDEISSGKRAVEHLFRTNSRRVEIYHSSFALFVQEQNECEEQRGLISKLLAGWLNECNHDYLKWYLLPKIQMSSGDATQLEKLSRHWLLAAMTYPRDRADIVEILSQAYRTAVGSKNFPEALRLSLLKGYYLNSLDDASKATEMLWADSYLLHSPEDTPVILSNLSYDELYEYVRFCVRKNDTEELVEQSLQILSEQQIDERFGKKGEIGSSSVPKLPLTIVKIAALNSDYDVSKVLKYIRQFSSLGWESDLLRAYSDAVLNLGNIAKRAELLSLEAPSQERSLILQRISLDDILNRRRSFVELLRDTELQLDLHQQAYLCLIGEKPTQLPPLKQPKLIPVDWPEYRSADRENISEIFVELFLSGLIWGASDENEKFSVWLSSLSSSWSHKVGKALAKSGYICASSLRNIEKVSIASVLDGINSISPLKWPEHREQIELQHGLKLALQKIVEFIRVGILWKENQPLLSITDLQMLASSPYFGEDFLVSYLVAADSPRVETDALEWLIESQLEFWERRVTTFSERSQRYAELARICRLHGQRSTAEKLLTVTADNTVAYGFHKDSFWYEILKSINSCHEAGSLKAVKWLAEVAQNVESVGDYTDGDETSDNDDYLTKLMEVIVPSLARARYVTSARSEKFYDAAYSFNCVLRSFEFESDLEKAVGMTAIDRASRLELASIAKKRQGAETALITLESYGGAITENTSDIETPPSLQRKSKTKNDFLIVHPDHLDAKLKSFSMHYEEQQYLISWARCWLQSNDKTKALKALCEYLKKNNAAYVDSELLDQIYPHTVSSNPALAFDLVCHAQSNDFGWSWYAASLEKTVRPRWNFVKKHFAARYWEFFEQSTYYSARRVDGRASQGNFPFVRAIEYFLEFGELELCEKLVETAIDFGKTLTANLQLPDVKWLNFEENSALDVLFQRLVESSPLVRERAATAIAWLLVNSETRADVFSALVDWLAAQELETISALALLPFLRAASEKPGCLSSLDLSLLTTALNHRSVVIDEELRVLASLTGTSLNVSTLPAFVCDKPTASSMPKFFFENAKNYADPHLQYFGKQLGSAFLMEWYLNCETLADKCSSIRKPGELNDYRRGYGEQGVLLGITVGLSEVYATAFLRVLHRSFNKGLLAREDFLEMAFKTLPIDLSFWQIEPTRAPDWWPTLGSEGDQKDPQMVLKFNYESEIRNLLSSRDEKTLLSMEGPLRWKNKLWNETDCYITIVAFAYRSVGSELPKAKNLCKFLFHTPQWLGIPTRLKDPMATLNDTTSFIPEFNAPKWFADIEVTPLVNRLPCLTGSLWQWFRAYPAPMAIAPLVDDFIVAKLEDSWEFTSNGQTVAVYQDWTEGLEERVQSKYQVPFGRYLEAQSPFLNEWLSKRNLRLGYVCELKHFYKDNDWDKTVKTFAHQQLCDVSTIIL